MLNLSEIHPNVRKTLHEIENAMVRDISPNTTQASVGQKIKDVYAKSAFIRMFSAVDSTRVYELDKNGERIETSPGIYSFTDNKEISGMNGVSIMGGELSKDDANRRNFKHMSGFQEMYNHSRWDKIGESNTTDGKLADRYRPLPGITSVSVEFAGSMKAIRNATINWTCFSFSDISRLTSHFLAHGKPVVLEWGWSSTKDMSDVRFMNIDKIADGSAYKQIQEKVWEMNGKYDAMAGLIKNFEWKTRDDGGFDCTTEITSMGVNTLNQQTKNESGGNVDNVTTPEGKKKDEEAGKFILTPTFEEFVGQLDKEIKALCSEGGWYGSKYFPPEKQPNGLMFFESNASWVWDKTFGPYLTWGWMEDNIISKFLGKINKTGGKNSREQVFSDFRSFVPIMEEDGIPKKDPKGKWIYESVKIANHPNLITADPYEFIFPGQWPFQDNHTVDGTYGIGADWKETQILYEMIHTTRKDDFLPFAVEGEPTKGYLRNIILHWEVVKEAFTGVTSVESGLQNIFNKLNAKYGIWNLKVTTASLGNEGRVMVIDENFTHRSVRELIDKESTLTNGKVDGLLYKFNVMNEKSIVKSHNLTAKLPSSMQTAAMFGANNSGESSTAAGNPGAVRLGKMSGQSPDESIGEMNMAWSRPKFGTKEPQDPNYNGGELSLDDGPPITINPGESDNTDSENDKKTPEQLAKEAKEKALKAQWIQTEVEAVFTTNLEQVNKGTHSGQKGIIKYEGDEKPTYEFDESDQKSYNEYGLLKEVGEIKWADVMKGIITTGPNSSMATRPLLIPLEIEVQLSGIGGIVPGNAFVTSYLPASYREWVAFQATDISHTIGTDGWTTSLKGLMRCAGTKKDTTVEKVDSDKKSKEASTKDETEVVTTAEEDKKATEDEEAKRLKTASDAANKKQKAADDKKAKADAIAAEEAAKAESKQKQVPPPPPKINYQIPATYESTRISENSVGTEYTDSYKWVVVYEAIEYRTFTDGSVKETNRATGTYKTKDRESADRMANQNALGNAGHWQW